MIFYLLIIFILIYTISQTIYRYKNDCSGKKFWALWGGAQSSECGRQRTLNSLHRHTAARLQSNESLAVWISQISTEWRECSIMTLSTIHWVPVQDKGSKILCGKSGAMKITPSDCLHQEYLTINLGSTSDWQPLKPPLVRLFRRWRGRCWPAGAA